MLTKKSVIVLLFVIALILALFSVGMTIYADSQKSSTGSTISEDDLGGNVNLYVLPQENATSINAAE